VLLPSILKLGFFFCCQFLKPVNFGVNRRGRWGGGGDISYSGLYGKAPRERGAFFKLREYQRVGKTSC